MKLGISLVGISHLVHDKRWPVNRSYETCYQNFFDEIYNPLKKKFNIDIYTTTYYSGKEQDIINTYKPKTSLFLTMENSHQIKTFLKALELIEKEKTDFHIFTRFDIFFNKDKIKNLNIDLNKFNFLCKEKDYWKSHEFVNDCFYVFNARFVPQLKKACINLLNNPPRPGLMDMHGLYSFLFKDESVRYSLHFMTDEHHLSGGNSIYTLKRL